MMKRFNLKLFYTFAEIASSMVPICICFLFVWTWRV